MNEHPQATAMAVAVAEADTAPELFDAGRFSAAKHGVDIAWEEAEAESLPYGARTFDAVLSCVDVMFAPQHQAAADELVRGCRPGSIIGLLSRSPEGFLGQLLATLKPYLPVPPQGAKPPSLWGVEAHVRGLLGERVTDARARKAPLGSSPTARRSATSSRTTTASPSLRTGTSPKAPLRPRQSTTTSPSWPGRHDLDGGVMEAEYLLLTARVAD